jgi:hypothetical protein
MPGFFDNDLIKNSIDYVLIGCLLIITIYYIYKTIVDNKVSSNTAQPPYDDTPNSSQNNQLSSLENKSEGSGISNAEFDPSVDNALRQYCIKSASNAAYTGGYMNLNMVKYLLSRGCRFLDFEVYIKDGTPIVAYSTNKNDYETYTSNNPAISLSGVFSTIMSNAFTDTSPNPRDPLFIHLRIKTHDVNAYSSIAKLIFSGLGQRQYSDESGRAALVTLETQMTDLLGKIVVIVDKLSSPGFDNVSVCGSAPDSSNGSTSPSCINSTFDYISLASVINMVSNVGSIRTYQQKELTFQPINPPDPSVYLFRIVFPDLGFFENTYNCDSNYLIKNYGTQVIAQAFYVRDTNLTNYENMFKSSNSAYLRIEYLANS